MKIRFKSNDNLPLNKKLKLHNLTIVFRSVIPEYGKYYPQIFLDACWYELWMLEYNRINASEGIDVNKTNASKEYNICHYWYFKYESYLCNGCHGLMQKTVILMMLLLFLLK